MGDLWIKLFDFIVANNINYLKRFIFFIIVVIILAAVNNITGFTYYSNIDKKVTAIKELSLISRDSLQPAHVRIFADSVIKEVTQRENLLQQKSIIFQSTKNKNIPKWLLVLVIILAAGVPLYLYLSVLWYASKFIIISTQPFKMKNRDYSKMLFRGYLVFLVGAFLTMIPLLAYKFLNINAFITILIALAVNVFYWEVNKIDSVSEWVKNLKKKPH